MRVLDIGCGWGGMALYLHAKTGAEVLGVTLSEEQLKVARRRAEEAGVADKVRFELIDYRDVDRHSSTGSSRSACSSMSARRIIAPSSASAAIC